MAQTQQTQDQTSEDPYAGFEDVETTTLPPSQPTTAYTPGQGDPAMEGGMETRRGEPMFLLEDHLKGKAPWVTLAQPKGMGEPTGQFVTATLEGEGPLRGRKILGRYSDYGPGVHGTDVATSTPGFGHSFPYKLTNVSPAADPYGEFEDVGSSREQAPQAAVAKPSRKPTGQEAGTAPKAVSTEPWWDRANKAYAKGGLGSALKTVGAATQQGLRRALNLPLTGDITKEDVAGIGQPTGTPLIGEQIKRVDEEQPTMTGILKSATWNALADAVNFMNTPEGASIMLLSGGTSPAVQRLITLGFSSQQIEGAIESAMRGNWQDALEQLLLGGLSAHGGRALAKRDFPLQKPSQPVESGFVGQTGKGVTGHADGIRAETEQASEQAPETVPVPEQVVSETAAVEPSATGVVDPYAGFEEPTAEEQAQIDKEYEDQLMSEAEEHMARGGDELLDVLKSHGLPAVGSKFAARYRGELENLRGMFKDKAGFSKPLTGISDKVIYSDLFKKDALGDLDDLTDHLSAKGFPVETTGDTLELIDKRLRTGTKVFGDETLAAIRTGLEQIPESAFPIVGLQMAQGPIDMLYNLGRKLNTTRKALLSMIKMRPQRGIVAQTYDAIENQAGQAGVHAGNEARLLMGGRSIKQTMVGQYREPKPTMDEQGIIPVMESFMREPGEGQGTELYPITQATARAKLIKDANKVITSKKSSPEMKRVYSYAVKNFERLSAQTPKIKALFDRQLKSEQAHGIDTDEHEGYVPHRYDMDVFTPGKPVVLDATGGVGRSSSFFMKQRVFDDYAEAISKGYVPRKFDIASLVHHRVRAGQMKINQRLWVDVMRNEKDPLTGKPIVTDLIKQPKGATTAPAGYVSREIFPGVRVGVSEFFDPLVKALTDSSHFPGVLSRGEGWVKHRMLMFDSFHLSRLLQMQAGLMGKTSWGKGLTLLEYPDSMLNAAVNGNEITVEMADYARKNRTTFQSGMRAGLNAGRISDALFKDVVSSAKLVGPWTKWLFDKVNRGIIAESYIYAFDRNQKLHPEWSETEMHSNTAREMNVYYRNLRSQGIFKRKTWQDAARFFTLAPQWWEGGITSELKGYGQVLKVPYDLATKKRLILGNNAKGLATGVLAYTAGTQLINLMTRGKPTWENSEPGQKWSAWVPDFLGSSNGFFLNPLSVFAENTHDFLKYADRYPNKIDVTMKIVQNKFSPMSNAIRDITFGKDYFGQPLEGVMDRVKQAALDVSPVPMGVRMAKEGMPTERMAASSLGFRMDVAPTNVNAVYTFADAYKRSHSMKSDVNRPPGEYSKLTRALGQGDMKTAKEEYTKLRKTKKKKLIDKHFKSLSHTPFTDKKHESKFRNSLDPGQRTIYQKARMDQTQIRQRYHQIDKISE
jgi:hypothetical protein